MVLATTSVVVHSPNLELSMPLPIWRPKIFSTFVFHNNYLKNNQIKNNFPFSLYNMFVSNVYLPRILHMRGKIYVC